MSSNRLLATLAAIGVILVVLYGSFFVVNPRQQAIVIRFGEIQRVESEPGIYFKLPFSFIDADRVQYVSKQDLRFDLSDLRIQVADGKFYIVDAFAVYNINDPERFREAVSGDRTEAEGQLRSLLDSALRRVYGLRGFQAALSFERASMMEEVQELLRNDAEKLGIKIVDVRVLRTDLTPEVSEDTYSRMKSERLAEAEAIRANGREQAETRRAVADRQVVEITSQAEKEAEILRGEGDGQRNRILGDAYGRDPAFFAFYRSMNAYKDVINDNATMVLSPNSEFFEYFGSSGSDDAPAPFAADVEEDTTEAPAGSN